MDQHCILAGDHMQCSSSRQRFVAVGKGDDPWTSWTIDVSNEPLATAPALCTTAVALPSLLLEPEPLQEKYRVKRTGWSGTYAHSLGNAQCTCPAHPPIIMLLINSRLFRHTVDCICQEMQDNTPGVNNLFQLQARTTHPKLEMVGWAGARTLLPLLLAAMATWGEGLQNVPPAAKCHPSNTSMGHIQRFHKLDPAWGSLVGDLWNRRAIRVRSGSQWKFYEWVQSMSHRHKGLGHNIQNRIAS